MTVSVFTPYVTATLNGTAINTALVKGARVESSFADPVSKGYVKCIGNPGASQGDAVTITLGAGANNVTRFPAGTVLQDDRLNSGPNFELICRGPMYAVQKYRNTYAKGLTLLDLTGGPATDEVIARAVLDVVGVSYSSGNIGGTGIVRGAIAAVGYNWHKGESALEYLQRLTKASLGYKMVESAGAIYRTQMLFGSTSGSPAFTLTEGVDIFEGAHVQITTFDTYSAWSVTGFDYGDGNGPVRFSYPTTLPTGVAPYEFSSEMIERALDADPGGGISAETVLGYIRGESGSALTKVSGLITPRDDVFGPGQLIRVSAPTLLGIDKNLWLISVTAEADDQWFTHSLELVG